MGKFGLVGRGIGGSLSPELFGSAYPGMQYDLIDRDSFADAVKTIEGGYEAVNVTSPFKEDAFRYAVCSDGVSERIEAVNILVRGEDGFHGYNSDYLAVRALLGKYAGDRRGKLLVVGCGGAGRAAAAASSDCGFETFVANRNVDRARSFCRRTGNLTALDMDSVPDLLGECVAAIYAVPVFTDAAARISSCNGLLKIEASYTNPSICGDRYIGGREWLALQAVAGYGIMTGVEPDSNAIYGRLLNL